MSVVLHIFYGSFGTQITMVAFILSLTRVALGSPAEHAALGGGVNIPPLLTHEPAAVARLARRQSKALNKYFTREF